MNNKKEIQNLIENKRVCIVGPAPYLNDLNMGKKIDDFDIIVRFNKGYNLSKDANNFGSRTDILYHCVCQGIDNGGPITEEMVNKYKIIFAYPCLSQNDNSSFPHGNLIEYKQLPKYISNINIVKKELYLEWERDIGCRPNTGIIAIFDILNMNPKEIYITGFTLFKDGYSNLYRNKINNIPVTEKDSKFKVLDRMFNAGYKGAHDQYLIYLYLKKHLLNKNNIKMDQILIDILNFDEKTYAINNNLQHLNSREIFIHYLYN
tara:strand:- start:2774 stop:3559 length:786 start_codon:yes stop_codon:yes gene_type:complete